MPAELDTAQLLAIAAALGWASGLRLYAVVFLTGLAGYLGWVDLPGGLQMLQGPVVLVASGFMLCVEFFADKIPALDTLWDGFNSSIIAMGQVGTGKTHCLFGSPQIVDGEDLCTQLLSTLFSRIRQSQTPQDFNILISMWDVVTDPHTAATHVMDLLRDPSDSLLPHSGDRDWRETSLACVAIESLSDALQAMEVGRSRSDNWTQDPLKVRIINSPLHSAFT